MHIRRSGSITATIAMLLALIATPVHAEDTYGYCLDGECGVGTIDREDAEFLAEGEDDFIFTDETDPPGLVVCLEGFEECLVKDDAVTLADVELVHDGRVVWGKVDADPSGRWATTHRKSKLTCKSGGTKLTQPVKRTQDEGALKWRDGLLISTTQGREPTPFVRLAPGLYGAQETINQGKDKVEITSSFGMVTEDKIKGTSIMRYSTNRSGVKGTCTGNRNYDMVRLAGPWPNTEFESVADGDDPGETVGEAPAEPQEMEFTEDEVDEVSDEAPAEDEATDETE